MNCHFDSKVPLERSSGNSGSGSLSAFSLSRRASSRSLIADISFGVFSQAIQELHIPHFAFLVENWWPGLGKCST
jgi:hypothetical protein